VWKLGLNLISTTRVVSAIILASTCFSSFCYAEDSVLLVINTKPSKLAYNLDQLLFASNQPEDGSSIEVVTITTKSLFEFRQSPAFLELKKPIRGIVIESMTDSKTLTFGREAYKASDIAGIVDFIVRTRPTTPDFLLYLNSSFAAKSEGLANSFQDRVVKEFTNGNYSNTFTGEKSLTLMSHLYNANAYSTNQPSVFGYALALRGTMHKLQKFLLKVENPRWRTWAIDAIQIPTALIIAALKGHWVTFAFATGLYGLHAMALQVDFILRTNDANASRWITSATIKNRKAETKDGFLYDIVSKLFVVNEDLRIFKPLTCSSVIVK
jgi:hypothetical protein